MTQKTKLSLQDALSKEGHEIPLASPTGQAAMLVKHAERLNERLNSGECSAADCQLLTDALVKTLESLRKISGVEQQGVIDPSAPKLVAALEHLTLTLSGSDQYRVSGVMDQLVGVLERLILVLQSREYAAVTGENANPVADTAK